MKLGLIAIIPDSGWHMTAIALESTVTYIELKSDIIEIRKTHGEIAGSSRRVDTQPCISRENFMKGVVQSATPVLRCHGKGFSRKTCICSRNCLFFGISAADRNECYLFKGIIFWVSLGFAIPFHRSDETGFYTPGTESCILQIYQPTVQCYEFCSTKGSPGKINFPLIRIIMHIIRTEWLVMVCSSPLRLFKECGSLICHVADSYNQFWFKGTNLWELGKLKFLEDSLIGGAIFRDDFYGIIAVFDSQQRLFLRWIFLALVIVIIKGNRSSKAAAFERSLQASAVFGVRVIFRQITLLGHTAGNLAEGDSRAWS